MCVGVGNSPHSLGLRWGGRVQRIVTVLPPRDKASPIKFVEDMLATLLTVCVVTSFLTLESHFVLDRYNATYWSTNRDRYLSTTLSGCYKESTAIKGGVIRSYHPLPGPPTRARAPLWPRQCIFISCDIALCMGVICMTMVCYYPQNWSYKQVNKTMIS